MCCYTMKSTSRIYVYHGADSMVISCGVSLEILWNRPGAHKPYLTSYPLCFTCTLPHDSQCDQVINDTCCMQFKSDPSYCSYCKISSQIRWCKMCVLSSLFSVDIKCLLSDTCLIAVWSCMRWYVCTFMAIKLFELKNWIKILAKQSLRTLRMTRRQGYHGILNNLLWFYGP